MPSCLSGSSPLKPLGRQLRLAWLIRASFPTPPIFLLVLSHMTLPNDKLYLCGKYATLGGISWVAHCILQLGSRKVE
jgi:hypothetical protein